MACRGYAAGARRLSCRRGFARVSTDPALAFVDRASNKRAACSYDTDRGLYGRRINALTHINLTKLDVLSELDTIRLGVGYKVDGKSIPSVPSEIATLEKVEMVYEDVPGWQSDISKVRHSLSWHSHVILHEIQLSRQLVCDVNSLRLHTIWVAIVVC